MPKHEPFTIDHIRQLHVSITPRVSPRHPSCIRMASEYSVMHFTADEAEAAAAQLLAAAKKAREPIQADLI